MLKFKKFIFVCIKKLNLRINFDGSSSMMTYVNSCAVGVIILESRMI